MVNALLFNQALTAFQYYGITAGLVATVIISAGDEILVAMGCKRAESEADDNDFKKLEGEESDTSKSEKANLVQ